jgi:hypothetical protein
MAIYQLPEWLGGAKAHLVRRAGHGQVELQVRDGDRPSGHHVQVAERELTKLPDPGAPTPEQVLATPMGPNDANAPTVREYLVELLAMLWEQGEGFSGKRPFGNSGWEYEVYDALVAQGYVATTTDRLGEPEPDVPAADELITQAIHALAGGAA